jgi:long-chain acyl-CoA synthetase
MLSHGAILRNCTGAYHLFSDDGMLDLNQEAFLSFLPLSHSYEHTAGLHFPLTIGAEIYYAEGIDKLSANMAEVHPTIMTAVPRLYESMHQRIISGVERKGGLSEKLFKKTVALGIKRYEHGAASLSLIEKIQDRVLEKLVRAKVAERFGGRLKAFVSGGAPLNYDVGVFFLALGVRLLQGYGQTETAPVVSANPPRKIKIDTVGPAFPDVEVKIAEDGEILVRGELNMQGYWNAPELTAETLRDGWVHTGDIGVLDEDGYIKITDRKKDIIVNSGGDNVSPQRVEGILVFEPELSQAMVYGDKRPHLVAVLVPDEAFISSWAKENDRKADLSELSDSEKFHARLREAIDRANARLSPLEQVRRFIVAEEGFTTENSLMTPSLKIRRHEIRKIYGERLEALYGRKRG